MDDNFSGPRLASISLDECIEKYEWKRVTGNKSDELGALYTRLGELYWSGVEREVAAAIIALADFEEHQPESLHVETYRQEDLSTDHLGKLVDLWNPFDNDHPLGAQLSDPSRMEALKERVHDTVANEFQRHSIQERRAQGLLQAMGLMDIDFVRERRRPYLRSMGQRPQIRESDGDDQYVLEAVQCSNCRYCVRAFHWFECRSGCKDYLRNTNEFSILPPDLFESVHLKMLSESVEKIPPYTLCPPCYEKLCGDMEEPAHPHDHLHIVRHFPEKFGPYIRSEKFDLQLDIKEDKLDNQLFNSFWAATLDRVAGSHSMFSRLSPRHTFPAGNTHCAVMFGPLIIENGHEYMDKGVLISLRNTLNFSIYSQRRLDERIADPTEYRGNVLRRSHLALSQHKQLYSSLIPVKERRFMSVQKQIAGGLFSFYCPKFADAEQAIINMLVHCSVLWREYNDEYPNAIPAEARGILKSYAQEIVQAIQELLGSEISKYLYSFTMRLHKNVKLKWNMVFNNCQNFSSSLIFNQDEWDINFAGVYPKIPPSLVQTEETKTLRYMMSFAGRMRREEFHFVSPVMSSLLLYNYFGHNDSDLIDHVTGIRTRTSDRQSTVAHDVYLMKNFTMTCEGKLHGCTLADHLLDGPHDNLSVLFSHIHRKSTFYAVPSRTASGLDLRIDELFINQSPNGSPPEWIQNRLEILHRLRLLYAYLGAIAEEFGSLAAEEFVANNKSLRVWRPVSSQLGRGWSLNKREGRTIVQPSWLEDMKGEMNNTRWTFLSTVWSTKPEIRAKEAWKARYVYLQKRLVSMVNGNTKLSLIPPGTCNCSTCELFWATRLCSRATRLAASLQRVEPKKRRVFSTYPDFVPEDQLIFAIRLLGTRDKAVTDCLQQLARFPEYLGYKRSTELLIEIFPNAYSSYKFYTSLILLQEFAPSFLDWLADVLNT